MFTWHSLYKWIPVYCAPWRPTLSRSSTFHPRTGIHWNDAPQPTKEHKKVCRWVSFASVDLHTPSSTLSLSSSDSIKSWFDFVNDLKCRAAMLEQVITVSISSDHATSTHQDSLLQPIPCFLSSSYNPRRIGTSHVSMYKWSPPLSPRNGALAPVRGRLFLGAATFSMSLSAFWVCNSSRWTVHVFHLHLDFTLNHRILPPRFNLYQFYTYVVLPTHSTW